MDEPAFQRRWANHPFYYTSSHHALAIADNALLMMDKEHFECGSTKKVLTEENLFALYGVNMKHVSFEFEEQMIESFVPILHHEIKK